MSDDERIARLTQLARRVPEWADKHEVAVEERVRGVAVTCQILAHGSGTSGVGANHFTLELLSIGHVDADRAADALEAALLVMAGERAKGQP